MRSPCKGLRESNVDVNPDCRNASSLESLERRGGSLLREFDGRLIFVEEPVENNTSSSLLRQLLAEVSATALPHH